MLSFLSSLGSQLISPSFMKWVLVTSCSIIIVTSLRFLRYSGLGTKEKKELTLAQARRLVALLVLTFIFLLASFYVLFAQSPSLISPQPPLDKAVFIDPNSPLVLVFDRPFAKEITATFSPALSGSWQFGYGQFGPLIPDRYIFTPTNTANPNTEYQLSVNRILPLSWVHLSQAQSLLLTLSTPANSIVNSSTASNPPDYVVRSYSPADLEEMVPLTPEINIEFDSIKSHDEIVKLISFTPSVAFETNWEGNTVSINVTQPLSSATTYILTLASPNLASDTPLLSWSFTTAPNTFSLDLPLYKQHHTFTCYSAASQMVLAYRDIKVGELSFLDEIGYDTTPRNYVNNSWGDPQKGIVGTYNGSGAGGYGAHWQPVAKAISNHRQVEIKENWNITEMLQTVKAGNPVMVWWVNGVWPAKELIWKNASGESVRGVNGMHVEIVKGWVGDQNNPTYILTNDPWRGYRQYKPEAFLNLWKWFNNTAVIVY